METDPDQMDTPPAQTVEPGEVTGADIDTVDALLNEVEEAMTAIDAGTYGQCHLCGQPIHDGRLAQRPTTQTCEACSA
ncbi:MAG: TraR/DksA family transcriptional regulator [Acidimicrobiales bacterium]